MPESHEHENEIRLADLKKRISKAKSYHQEVIPDKVSTLSAPRMVTEMFSGVLVGGVMGYYLDHWLSSKPLFFIIFVFLGIAAAILNIYKLASAEAVEAETKSDDASSKE